MSIDPPRRRAAAGATAARIDWSAPPSAPVVTVDTGYRGYRLQAVCTCDCRLLLRVRCSSSISRRSPLCLLFGRRVCARSSISHRSPLCSLFSRRGVLPLFHQSPLTPLFSRRGCCRSSTSRRSPLCLAGGCVAALPPAAAHPYV